MLVLSEYAGSDRILEEGTDSKNEVRMLPSASAEHHTCQSHDRNLYV